MAQAFLDGFVANRQPCHVLHLIASQSKKLVAKPTSKKLIRMLSRSNTYHREEIRKTKRGNTDAWAHCRVAAILI
jgi:hypothetical protein